MIGLLLVGIVAYTQLPVSALPQVDYPTIQVAHLLPGREPRRDGLVGDRAAGAAVRTGPRPQPDDLDQLVRQLDRSRCSSTSDQNIDVAEQQVQAAINAATHLSAPRPAEPARSTTRSTPPTRPSSPSASPRTCCPLSKVEDLADTTLAQKISQLPGVGLVSIGGGQKPAVRIQADPDGPRLVRPEPRGPADGARPGQRRPGEGHRSTGRGSRSPSGPTTSSCRATGYRSLIVAYRERRARAPLRRRRPSSTASRTRSRRPG